MNVRFLFAASSSTLLLPQTIDLVQSAAEVAMLESNLGAFNPGNAAGKLLSYAAAGALVSLISKLAGVKRVTQRDVLWWGGAVTVLSGTFVGVRKVVEFYVSPELGLLSAAAALGVGGFVVLKFKIPEYAFDPHIQGLRIKKSFEIRKERRFKKGAELIPWGADFIEQKLETEHFLAIANIGGGKTLFMKMCMASVARRENELWLCFDPKPQFVPYLEALGRKVVILNPLDKRRVCWDISGDVVDFPTAQTFAASLIKVRGGVDDYWVKSARKLLTAVLMYLIRKSGRWGLRDVLLIVSDQELLKHVVGESRLNAIIAEGLQGKNERSGTNDYMLNLTYNLSEFEPVAALMHQTRDSKGLSIKELIKSENYGKMTLVLGSDEESRETIKTFNGLFFENFVNSVLSLLDSDERRIWLWIDELASVAEFVGDNLARFQEKARSKGGCSFIATQSYPGLTKKIRQDATDQIIELSKHIAVPGGVDGKTAQILSETYFGEVEVAGTQFNEKKEYESKKGVGYSPDEHEVNPSYSSNVRPLVRKELLYSTSIPKTGPENGLTGFFYGSQGGPHWHTYKWKEVMDMTVKDAEGRSAYEREDTRALDEIPSWSEEEREKWGFPQGGKQKSSLSENRLSYEDALTILKCDRDSLNALLDHCGLTGVKRFSRDEFTRLLAKITELDYGFNLDWEDDEL